MKTSLVKTLHTSRNYTLAVAVAMPEKSYSFKPTKEVWNFNELMNHIAYGIHWWGENFIKGNQTEWSPPDAKNTKEQTVEYLTQAFDELEKTMNSIALSDAAVKGFHATLDHITHHRGEAVTYLRCQGIVPPEYTY